MKTNIQPEKDNFTEDSELNETQIQPEKDNFTEDSELNENWNSTQQRQFYGRLRIKGKLKFNPTKRILQKIQD